MVFFNCQKSTIYLKRLSILPNFPLQISAPAAKESKEKTEVFTLQEG